MWVGWWGKELGMRSGDWERGVEGAGLGAVLGPCGERRRCVKLHTPITFHLRI